MRLSVEPSELATASATVRAALGAVAPGRAGSLSVAVSAGLPDTASALLAAEVDRALDTALVAVMRELDAYATRLDRAAREYGSTEDALAGRLGSVTP